jgi:hypothetical protein
MSQITLDFEASLIESYPTCREYVASLVHQQGRPQKAIAADMDYSPSDLTRKLAQAPEDSRRFTVDDLELFMQKTRDFRAINYLAEKYLASDTAKRIAELEAENARLKNKRR